MKKSILLKRITSLFCVVTLVLSTTSMAFAKGTDSEIIEYPETIEISSEIIETNNLSVKTKELKKTNFESIYVDDFNEYYEYIDETQVLPMEKEVLKFDKTTNIEVACKELNLPKEVVNELQKYQVQFDDNAIKEITLFIPDKVISTRGNNNTETSAVYKYNGQSFYDYIMFGLNDYTGYETVTSGLSASQIANSIKTGVLTVAGLSKSVSGYAAGATLLEEYLKNFGYKTITPTSDDSVEMSHYFDHYTKLTYMQVPTSVGTSWYCGNIAQKMKMIKVKTRQKYSIKNSAGDNEYRDFTHTKTLTGEIISPNYNEGYKKAYTMLYNKNPQDYNTNREYVKYTIPNTKINIGF